MTPLALFIWTIGDAGKVLVFAFIGFCFLVVWLIDKFDKGKRL